MEKSYSYLLEFCGHNGVSGTWLCSTLHSLAVCESHILMLNFDMEEGERLYPMNAPIADDKLREFGWTGPWLSTPQQKVAPRSRPKSYFPIDGMLFLAVTYATYCRGGTMWTTLERVPYRVSENERMQARWEAERIQIANEAQTRKTPPPPAPWA
jgi:hypothetical protein